MIFIATLLSPASNDLRAEITRGSIWFEIPTEVYLIGRLAS